VSQAFILWATVISALASVVNAVCVVVLAWITNRYADITARILDESRKSREAAEKQASAAQRSVDLLQNQIEDQLGLGRGIVRSAIQSSLSAISYWRQRPLTNTAAAPGFPPPDDLIPANSAAAVEHARRVSPEAAQAPSSAFDDLRNVVNEIERTRLLTSAVRGMGHLEPTPSKAPTYLESAFTKLQNAKTLVS
jgi:hypothetical protein